MNHNIGFYYLKLKDSLMKDASKFPSSLLTNRFDSINRDNNINEVCILAPKNMYVSEMNEKINNEEIEGNAFNLIIFKNIIFNS